MDSRGGPFVEGCGNFFAFCCCVAGSGSSVCVEGRALMIGTLPSGRGRVSGQGSRGALMIYWP